MLANAATVYWVLKDKELTSQDLLLVVILTIGVFFGVLSYIRYVKEKTR